MQILLLEQSTKQWILFRLQNTSAWAFFLHGNFLWHIKQSDERYLHNAGLQNESAITEHRTFIDHIIHSYVIHLVVIVIQLSMHICSLFVVIVDKNQSL
jgi:hypothetical protein